MEIASKSSNHEKYDLYLRVNLANSQSMEKLINPKTNKIFQYEEGSQVPKG